MRRVRCTEMMWLIVRLAQQFGGLNLAFVDLRHLKDEVDHLFLEERRRQGLLRLRGLAQEVKNRLFLAGKPPGVGDHRLRQFVLLDPQIVGAPDFRQNKTQAHAAQRQIAIFRLLGFRQSRVGRRVIVAMVVVVIVIVPMVMVMPAMLVVDMLFFVRGGLRRSSGLLMLPDKRIVLALEEPPGNGKVIKLREPVEQRALEAQA